MLRNFVSCSNDVETDVFMVGQWTINHVDFIDEYGDPLPNYGNGSQFLPEEEHGHFLAMCLVEPTGYTYGQLLDLPYAEFVRVAALVRAKRWTPATKNPFDRYK